MWIDAYYNPEKLGLEIIGEAEDTDASYSFDKFVVWRDQNGLLYYATDTGCSCPSPFESYEAVSDLTQASIADIHTALDEWVGDSKWTCKRPTATELHAKLAEL